MRGTVKDLQFVFLRNGSCKTAILACKNANKAPVTVQKIMDDGTIATWNNHSDVKDFFLLHYCLAEGLTRSHKMVRKVELYLSLGEYMYRAKKGLYIKKPIIQGIHYKIINGRSRFVVHVAQYFATLITLLLQKPSLKPLLEDEGVGKAPPEYLAAVEEGLRNYANDKYAMGCGAMRTRYNWLKVAIWRKREAYITMVRHVNKKPTYKKWNCFRWEDYTHRNITAKTFSIRHEPLTNSCDVSYEPYLSDPEDWNKASEIPYDKESYSKARTKSKSKRAPKPKTITKSTRTRRAESVMKFDEKTNTFYLED